MALEVSEIVKGASHSIEEPTVLPDVPVVLVATFA